MEFPLKICCSLLAALCLMGSGHALTQPNILEAGAQEQPASQSAPAWEEDQLEEYARQVFALTNQLREEEGLPALAWQQDAAGAAGVRAEEIITSFSHTRPNGKSGLTALKEAGLSLRGGAGENLAAGQQNPQEVMEDWMASPSHRENLLRDYYTSLGVAVRADENGRLYWVQLFLGEADSAAPQA